MCIYILSLYQTREREREGCKAKAKAKESEKYKETRDRARGHRHTTLGHIEGTPSTTAVGTMCTLLLFSNSPCTQHSACFASSSSECVCVCMPYGITALVRTKLYKLLQKRTSERTSERARGKRERERVSLLCCARPGKT